MISKKHEKVCTTLNYIETHPTGCVSISIFAFLVSIPEGITSSAIGLKICIITATIKKYLVRRCKIY